MFQNYLKIAWRNLLKNRVVGFINIAGLAIGMGVAMMIGMWVYDELTYNTYHDNYDKIGQLHIHQTFNDEVGTSRAVSLPTAPTLREQYGSDIEKLSLTSWQFEHLLTYENNRFIENGNYAEPTFPSIFSLKMIAGKMEDVLHDPKSIILAKSLADALFGSENPIGKTVRFDSTFDLEVTGIFEDLPFNTELKDSKFFTTWELFLEENEWARNSLDSWGNHSFQMYVQLADNASFEDFSAKVQDIEKEHNEHGNPEYFLHPMSKWHLHSNFKDGFNVGGRIQFVWLFSIIGVFVLLLACINFMNLSTARSEKRAKEVGIRKTVGSSRGQLINQFFSESLLVSFLAMIIAIAFVQISLTWFNELADKQLNIPIANPIFWALLLGFTLFTGLVAGSYPAIYLSSFKPIKALKGKFKAGRWAGVPRKVLVTLQFTVSVALIIGTIVVFQQIEYAKNRPIGYDRNGIVQFANNTELQDKYEVLRNELLGTGVVENVGHSGSPITQIWSNRIGYEWEGKAPNATPSFGVVGVSQEFGETVGWDVLEGRDFSKEFSRDTLSVILNEAAVTLTGIENPVGKTFKSDDVDFTIIGVVKNLVMESPYRPIKPTLFFLDQDWVSYFTVRLKEGHPIKDALAKIESVYTKFSPSSPFQYEFIDEEYNQKFISEERIGKLARIFAILAILISCLGLFGLSAFVAEQRTKEIGIRKVLGASVTNLWALQSKSFVVLVILSCLIAVPLAWYYLENWLADYDYRIDLGWEVFLVAGILALLVTLATVSYQSLKAALATPIKALKSE